jgi:hypothetical protein
VTSRADVASCDRGPTRAGGQPRQLGQTSLGVPPLGLGCWPLAGLTSAGVTAEEAVATVRGWLDQGLHLVDTAHSYGRAGESDLRIGRAIAGRRHEVTISSKVGLGWDRHGRRRIDGSPSTLRRQCETSLTRLRTDHPDILYLHEVDPHCEIEESAAALEELLQAGKNFFRNHDGVEYETTFGPPRGIKMLDNEIRGVTDHYKWRGSARRRNEARANSAHTWAWESKKWLAYLEARDWRLPLHGAFPVSTEELVKRGFLRGCP